MNKATYLTTTDIAEIADVKPATVSNWRTRHEKDFPQPVAGTTASPQFAAPEIYAWLKAHGKTIKDLAADSALWNFLNRWRGSASPEDLSRFVSAMLVWRYLSDATSAGFIQQLPETAQWGTLVEKAFDADLRHLLARGVAAFYDTAPAVDPQVLDVLRGSRTLPEHDSHDFLAHLIKVIDDFAVDQLGEIYVSFQDRLTTSMRRGYDGFSTSPALIELLVAVTKDLPGPVHDPALGSGRLLFAVGNEGENRTQLTGQELNVETYIQAAQRALVTGQSNIDLRQGDVFTMDSFAPNIAPVVVVDPPYGARPSDREHRDLALDPRLTYGTPPKVSLDTAWLQLALWYLAPKGRAFVLQPAGSAHRGGADAKIRANMLKDGTIEAIVALPAGVAGHTSIPVDLWVLARPGETTDPDRVLLIDHSEQQDIDVDLIAQALEDWRTRGTVSEAAQGGVFEISDILEKDSILTPKRWIAFQDDALTVETVQTHVASLDHAVTAFNEVKLSEPVVLTAATYTPKLVSITQLKKLGSLDILRVRGRISNLESDPDGTPVIDGPWIRYENVEPETISLEGLPGEPILTEPGDILLQNMGGLAARVDHDGGRVLTSQSFQVLRLQDDRFLPHYVAEMLVSSANRRQAMGAGIQRIRLDDLEIPVLSVADQHQLVEHFDTIRQLQATAQHILATATTTRDALVDGITTGIIQVH